MKLGNKIFFSLLFFLSIFSFSKAEDKITTTSLINIDEIKPSFEQLEEANETFFVRAKKKNFKLKSSQAILIN